MCSKDEEPMVLQQFLRFGETRPITQQLILQELSDKTNDERHRAQTEIKKLIERNSLAAAQAAAAAAHQRLAAAASPPTPASIGGGSLSPRSRHTSPGRRTPSVGSPPSSSSNFLLSPKHHLSPSATPTSVPPPTSPIIASPLNKLQNMQPFDYRKQDRKTPDDKLMPGTGGVAVPPSMRIPPTSMAAAAAAGFAAAGLPGLSSLPNYHNSITSMANNMAKGN